MPKICIKFSLKNRGKNIRGSSFPAEMGRLCFGARGSRLVTVRRCWLTGNEGFLDDDILAALIILFFFDVNADSREIIFLLRRRRPRFSDALHRFLISFVHAFALLLHCLARRSIVSFLCHVMASYCERNGSVPSHR